MAAAELCVGLRGRHPSVNMCSVTRVELELGDHVALSVSNGMMRDLHSEGHLESCQTF